MQPRFGFGRARHRRPGLLYLAGVFALSATLITPSGIAVADQPEPVDDPASYVDPFIGTTNSGNVYPGAVLPFGMLSWSPTNTSNNQTSAPAAGGYQYNVPKTRGFSLTHMNGTGCTPGASGDIPIYPHVGDVTSSPSADSTDAIYASRWNRPGSFTPILGSISSRVLQITANAENPPNEIAVNLNDQSQSTKWLTFTSTGWVVYRLSEPVAVVRYALTSANDFQQRDPRNWTLQGSHDGVTWTVVDSQAGEVFASRFQTNQYEFDNDTAYLYYKLDVTLNGGTNIVQLAELQLSDGDDTPPPPPPADVEVAEPGYYKVDLNSGVRTELTTTMRTGSGRFTFPAGEPANLLFRVSNSLTGSVDATVDIDVANNLVSGSVDSGGFCGGTSGGNVNRRHYYSLYFVAEFDHPFTSYGTWVDANLFPGTTSASGGEGFTSRAGRGSGGYVGFDTSQDETVNVRVGISYVSVDNAKENLDAENPPGTDFDTLRADAYETWRNQLDRIKVSGGTDDQRTIFYTALYHALLQPSLFNDVNGEYSGSDLATHTLEPGQGAQYGTFSGWDVYRGQVQMLAFLEPEVAADYAQSLFNFAKQRDGEWDRWLHNQGKTGVMAGDPSAPTVAGMYAFGATDFDVHGALDSLVTAATVPTANDNSDLGCAVQCVGQRPSLDRYLVLGYVPNDNSHSWGSAGETLEDAVADYALAGLAYRLGDTETYNEFLVRADNWKNVFNPEAGGIGYIQRRHSNGSWVTPFSATSSNGFAEGNSARYTWMIYHNVAGLAGAMGGNETAIARLDGFFHFTDGSWAITGGGSSRFDATNEPDIQTPWLYNYFGVPWKTQETVRQVMNTVWSTGTGGIPGNDDLGTLSSWYLWAAMGIYPQIPSRAELVVAAPLFPRIEIQRANGVAITIDAPEAGTDAKYIHALAVNGKPTTRTWIPETIVRHGGTLAYELGADPNTEWGTAPTDAPPGMGYYDHAGFFGPLSDADTTRTVKAGAAVPLIFGLGGDQGLDIFAAGSPSFQPTSCTTGEALAPPTATTSLEPIVYDPELDRYTYVWKTAKSQTGTCGRLELTTIDGDTISTHIIFR